MGVDGALIVAPYYNKPSQEGLFRHFQAIARATALPIMLYNIPGRCGVDIGADTVERLAYDCGNVVSIKEASGSVDRVSELRMRMPEAFTILSGDDGLTLPFHRGGCGRRGERCLEPAAGRSLRARRRVPQRRSHDRRSECIAGSAPIFKDLFIEPNPVPVKTALAWRGRMSNEVRLPLCEMTAANEARLRKTLDAFAQVA